MSKPSRYFPGKTRKTRTDKKTAAQLTARGSTLTKDRAKEEKGGVREPSAWRRLYPPSVHVSEITRPLLGLLPGYDPFAAAGKRGRTRRGVWYFAHFRFSPSRACRAINWIEQRCTHIRGRLGGQAFVLSPVERCIVANLFGWLRKDGTRRYRKCLIYVARKFGKTLLSAAILLYLLLEDGEYGAEVYCAASRRDQAKRLWAPAKGMIRNDRHLKPRLKLYQHSIVVLDETGEPGDSYFQAICAEAHAAHGYNPHAYAVDEVHTQKDGELSDTLDTGTAARHQPMGLYVTTAPHEGPTFCGEIYKYACGVRDGTIDDPHYLPCIFETTKEDDWRSEKAWRKANPHYPITPTRDYMESRCKLAGQSPRFLNTFLRHNCNQQTQTDVVWFNIEDWDKGAEPFDLDGLVSQPCHAGLDMSTVSDLTAFVLYFPGTHHVVPFFWAPRDTATRRDDKSLPVSYTAWERDGHMELCRGGWVDQDDVLKRVRECCERFNVVNIAVDRWNSTKAMTELSKDGIDVVEFGQGYASMSEPAKELERLVIAGKIRHGGHPVLRWCAGNVMVVIDDSPAENIKPVKAKTKDGVRQQDDNKIDGIVALVMALGLALETETVPDWAPEVYTV
jgi:phage terminase large subunit-like protein